MKDENTVDYRVLGMTCGHCAAAVASEISNLSGVRDVAVDVVDGGTSTVTVVSDAPLPETDIAAALQEAGDYRLAGG